MKSDKKTIIFNENERLPEKSKSNNKIKYHIEVKGTKAVLTKEDLAYIKQ
jgi:hypothetical protein